MKPDPFSLADAYKKTIEAARDTAELGELFLSSYKNQNEEKCESIIKEGDSLFQNQEPLHARRHSRERGNPGDQQFSFEQQTSKKTSSSSPRFFSTQTLTRAAKAFVTYLASSSLFNNAWQQRTQPLRSLVLEKLPLVTSGLAPNMIILRTDPFVAFHHQAFLPVPFWQTFGAGSLSQSLTHSLGQPFLRRTLGITSLLLSQLPRATGTTQIVEPSSLPSFLVFNETRWNRPLPFTPAAIEDVGTQHGSALERYKNHHEIFDLTSLENAVARRKLQGPISDEFQINTITT